MIAWRKGPVCSTQKSTYMICFQNFTLKFKILTKNLNLAWYLQFNRNCKNLNFLCWKFMLWSFEHSIVSTRQIRWKTWFDWIHLLNVFWLQPPNQLSCHTFFVLFIASSDIYFVHFKLSFLFIVHDSMST